MLFHLLHPLVIYLTHTQPAPTRMPALDHESMAALDSGLRERLLGSVATVQSVGFGPPLFAAGMAGYAFDSVVAFFERPDQRALGVLLVAQGAGMPLTSQFTVSTRFADGRELATSNFGGVLRTPRRPKYDGIAIPGHLGLGPLWAVHNHRIRAAEAISPIVPMTRGDDPLGYELEELSTQYDFWVKRRYYRRLPTGEIKSTAYGATMAAWRGLWPWKQLTDRDNRRRTADAVHDMPLLQ